MERNQALENYQKKTYKQNVASYTFSTTAGGITSDESVILKAKKPGINLHFLRYGVFKDDHVISYRETIKVDGYVDPDWDTSQQPVVVTGEGGNQNEKPDDKLPDLKHVYYAKTQLQPGYLYIIEEGDNKHWLEYEINVLGGLNPILWKDNLDKNNNYKEERDKASKKTDYSITFKACTIVWVGYSATQFSLEQLEELKTDPSTNECFRRVECEGFLRDNEVDNREAIVPYDRLNTSFNPENEKEAKIFEKRLRAIDAIEQAPDPENENDLLEDMFIALLDPLGCADDIDILLEKEHRWHEALIETLTRPQTPHNYYVSKWEKGKEELTKISAEDKEQVSYLYVTALSTYKFVYENLDTEDDYSRNEESWTHGVDKAKIYKILNIKGREHQRKCVYRMRDALGTFIKSEHYQNALLSYSNNIATRQETGKDHAMEHVFSLVIYEGMADRDLSLAKDYKPHDDYWIKEIREIVLNGSKAFEITQKLFDLKIDIAAVEALAGPSWKDYFKFSKKFLSISKKITGIYAALGPISEGQFKIYNSRISYQVDLSAGGKKGPFYKFHNKTYKSFLNSPKMKEVMNDANTHRTKTHTYLKIHPSEVERVKKLARISKNVKEPLIYVDRVNRAKYGAGLEEFLASPGFMRVLLVYELFALGLAIHDVSKKGGNFKTISSVVGATVKSSAIALKLTENGAHVAGYDKVIKKYNLRVPRLINRATNVEKTIPLTYKNTGSLVGKAGGIITVLMCSRDSYIAFANADYDVAVAQAVAGVTSGILLLSSLEIIATLAFTPALILGIVTLVALGIAYYFTDTKLEAYFKHYPLSTYCNINDGWYDLKPYEFMLKLQQHKEELLWPNIDNILVTRSNEDFKDFKQVFVDLMNIIAVCSLEIRGSESVRSPRDPQTAVYPTPKPYKDKWYHPWRSMGININFGAFLRDIKDLEYEIYYVMPKTLFAKGYSIPIPKNKIDLIPITDSNTGLFMVHLWLQIPEKLNIIEYEEQRSIMFMPRYKKQLIRLNLEEGKIAILCKLNNVHEEGFPLTKNYKQGYLYNVLPIQYRDDAGFVTRNTGIAPKVTKAQFLSTYPLKRINYE